MRIILSYGLVGRGGDAVQLLEIAEALRTLGHEVTLLGPHKLRPYDFSGFEGHIRNLARKLPWWAKDLIELWLDWRFGRYVHKLFQKQSFDLIFHRAGIYDTAGVRMAKKFGCPLIIWLDAPFPIERAFRQESYFKSLHISRMRALGQQAQRIVTVSRVAKEYYSQLGLPEAKILILPNGIPERLLRKGMEFALKRRPFSQPHECVVGFVGSLSRWHGVTFLLDALRELLNFQSVQWRLQIVGYGEEYKRLCAQAHQLGVSPFVEWLGALPHEQAFERIAQFDIAVLPHTLPTGAPMKLFEYAALARPVIAPDFPNLRAWFTNDELCFIKPEDPQALADAILSLCKAPKEAQEMGLRAQARVAEYTWEKIVQRILNDVQL